MSSTLKSVRWLFATAVITLFASGCEHGFSHLSDSEHTHDKKEEVKEEEGKTAVITVWADRFEAFIEHDYLIVDTPTKFITHISDLVTLKPRREGAITFVMKFGADSAIKQVVPKVARDGIYLPMIKFPKPGTWKVHIEVPLGDKTYTVKLPDATVFKDEESVRNAPDPEEIDGITYLKEQQWKIGTGADPVEKRTLREQLRVSARVKAPLTSKAQVVAPFAGALLPPKNGKIPAVGSRVEVGQVLALIQPAMSNSDLLQMTSNKLSAENTKMQVVATRTQLRILVSDLDIRLAEAEAKIVQARVQRDYSQRALTRVELLYSQKAKSTKDLQKAQFENEKATTRLEVAKTLVNRYKQVKKTLGRLVDLNGEVELPESSTQIPFFELKAPISGIVVKRHGVVGELADPSHPSFTIQDPSVVWIEVRVPESKLPKLVKNHAATFERPGAEGRFAPILGQGGGRFLHIGLDVDTRTRTIPLIYTIPNKEGLLRNGMSLAVYLETRQSVETLSIPDSAIVEEDGQPIAFVHVSGETYEKRELALGIRDGNWVEVKSGLKLNERVVTKGAYNIRLASLSTKLPVHGHAH